MTSKVKKPSTAPAKAQTSKPFVDKAGQGSFFSKKAGVHAPFFKVKPLKKPDESAAVTEKTPPQEAAADRATAVVPATALKPLPLVSVTPTRPALITPVLPKPVETDPEAKRAPASPEMERPEAVNPAEALPAVIPALKPPAPAVPPVPEPVHAPAPPPSTEASPKAPAVAEPAKDTGPDQAAAPPAVEATEQPTAMATPGTSESAEKPAAPAVKTAPPPAKPSAETVAKGGAPSSPATGAAAAPKPQLDATDSQSLVNSLAASPPTAFFQGLKEAGPLVSAVQQKEKNELNESLPEIEQPTGVPVKGEQSGPRPKTELTTEVAPDLQPKGKKEGQQLEVKHAQTVAKATIANVPTPQAKGDDDPAFASKIKNAIAQLPTRDDEVNTSAGERPRVDMSGEADTTQNDTNQALSDEKVRSDQGQADAATTQDFGENDIYPDIKKEMLRPNIQLSPAPPPPVAGSLGELPETTAEVYAAFDLQAQAQMDEQVQVEMAKNEEARLQMEADSSLEREEGQRKIDEETERVRTEQVTAQQGARSEVDGHRQGWQAENEKVKQDYAGKSEAKKMEIDGQIDAEVKQTDEKVETNLATAEAEAQTETQKSETEAARMTAEAEQKEKGKGFWDSVTDAISDFFDQLKKGLNALFDGLRQLVKGIIEVAKKAVNALIDLARKAIVGFIKAFGEALKAFVNVALAAFPEIAKRVNNLIDKAVNVAVHVVNTLADGLKKLANALLDAIGAVLDAILSAYQAAFNALLDVLEFITVGIIKILQGIANLVEAASNMPDQFWGQVSEEMLGVDVTKPLPNERPMPGKTADTAQQMVESGAISNQEAEVAQKTSLETSDVTVENVPSDFELDHELMSQVANMPEEGSVSIDTEEEGGEQEVEKLKHEALTGQPVVENSSPTGGEDEPMVSTATEEPAVEPGAAAQQGEAEGELVGPFSGPGERLSHVAGQMRDAITKWWEDNKVAIIAGLILGIAGVILANILTGGAILAALPLLMQIVGALFAAQAIANATKYFGNFLGEAFPGNIMAGAIALARASAIIIIEVVSSLLFVGKGAIKGLKSAAKTVAKQGVKSALKTGTKAAKTAATGALKSTGKAAKELGQVAKAGAKATLKNGKLALTGIKSGLGRGAKSFGTLAKTIAKKMRMKRIKIERRKFRFFIFGEFNPWVLLASGEIKHVDAKDIKDLTKARVGDKVRLINPNGTENLVHLIHKSDNLSKNAYKRIFELATGISSKGKVIHHMIEQQTMKMSAAINKAFINHSSRLKAFPQGIINETIHLSKDGIRGLWDNFYLIIRPMVGKSMNDEQFIKALMSYAQHTDDFIESTLKSLSHSPSKQEIHKVMVAWRFSNSSVSAIKKAIEASVK